MFRPAYPLRCPETPAQGSHHTLLRSGGEPASTAFRGGRSSLGVAVSRKSIAHIQLFVCHGGQQKGKAVLKQRLAHWIVDAIALAYQSQGEPCPLGSRAHSTLSVASSYALVHGASLADTCRSAGWATLNNFARFQSFCVELVSSHVLGNR